MNIVYPTVKPIATETVEWVSTNYLNILIISILILIVSVIALFTVKSDKIKEATSKFITYTVTANLVIGMVVLLNSHSDIAKSIIVGL
ncbi:hypothetical protein [Staphylococcus sp. GDX8P102P-2]|uniref:hypothetical protein n=1 Tax=Staphylococcus sp. GDX8P102P-2 TaxID=2804106 RepID=UPI001AEC16D5|nr:hypothetical protein [Staphylococcus sp. GDX8P102P-2]